MSNLRVTVKNLNFALGLTGLNLSASLSRDTTVGIYDHVANWFGQPSAESTYLAVIPPGEASEDMYTDVTLPTGYTWASLLKEYSHLVVGSFRQSGVDYLPVGFGTADFEFSVDGTVVGSLNVVFNDGNTERLLLPGFTTALVSHTVTLDARYLTPGRKYSLMVAGPNGAHWLSALNTRYEKVAASRTAEGLDALGIGNYFIYNNAASVEFEADGTTHTLELPFAENEITEMWVIQAPLSVSGQLSWPYYTPYTTQGSTPYYGKVRAKLGNLVEYGVFPTEHGYGSDSIIGEVDSTAYNDTVGNFAVHDYDPVFVGTTWDAILSLSEQQRIDLAFSSGDWNPASSLVTAFKALLSIAEPVYSEVLPTLGATWLQSVTVGVEQLVIESNEAGHMTPARLEILLGATHRMFTTTFRTVDTLITLYDDTMTLIGEFDNAIDENADLILPAGKYYFTVSSLTARGSLEPGAKVYLNVETSTSTTLVPIATAVPLSRVYEPGSTLVVLNPGNDYGLGAWSSFPVGTLVEWDGTNWLDLGLLQDGDNVGCVFTIGLPDDINTADSTLGGKRGSILKYDLTSGTFSILEANVDMNATANIDPQSAWFGRMYCYSAPDVMWFESGGASSISAGFGVSYTGNTLNVGATGALVADDDSLYIQVDTNSGLRESVGSGLGIHLSGSSLNFNERGGGILVNTGWMDNNYASLAGTTFIGDLVLAGDPTSDLQAVPKQYVDAIGNKLAGYRIVSHRAASTIHSVPHTFSDKWVTVVVYDDQGNEIIPEGKSLQDTAVVIAFPVAVACTVVISGMPA